MTFNKILEIANRLRDHFVELQQIMIQENETNWLRGIETIIGLLNFNQSEDLEDKTERLRKVLSINKTMNAGYGSFSDFHIWRDDFDERVQENESLKTIQNQIQEEMDNLCEFI